MAMTLKDTLAQLESLGNEKVRAHNKKYGAGGNQFGVPLGDIRKLAAKIKTNDQLAVALWDTGNIDARLLAILIAFQPISAWSRLAGVRASLLSCVGQG